MNDRRLIGLTGGIASGKTVVSQYLTDRYQIPVLDADRYARDAVEIGSTVWKAIIDRYGKEILLTDSNIDRQKLGNIVFNNQAERHWLESHIHPFVRDCFESQLQKIVDRTVILAIPLLFEAKMTDLVTEIWVITCPDQIQIERLMKRDRLTEQQALARIQTQLPIAEKIAAADRILDNSSTLEALYQQIDRNFLS